MELAPKRAGFEPERINRITDHLNRSYIEPGKIAGCQTLVARHGHVAYFKSFGLMDRERRKPMADDTIFRIYSMTKPIASVALMTLYEQGHFQLNDPVSRFIPAWREHKVWVSGEGANMQTVAPERPMTMRHILSHTGGLTYGATRHPVDRVYREAVVNRGAGETLATFAEKLAKVPLR
jgi:CubicO group peptidase (beta-lactamase class C family)